MRRIVDGTFSKSLQNRSIILAAARAYLEGRILCCNLREADYIAEVDGHRLVILCWCLVYERIHKFTIIWKIKTFYLARELDFL